LKVWVVYDIQEVDGGYLPSNYTVRKVVDSEAKAIKETYDYRGNKFKDMDYDEFELE
jgi:hypothetical protein